MHVLTSLQEYRLLELINTSIGQTASVISGMVRTPVNMYASRLNIMGQLSPYDLPCELTEQSVSAISQRFSGDFSGEAALILTDKSSFKIVRNLLGQGVAPGSLSDLEQDALKEAGSILVTSSLAVLFDISKTNCSLTLPYLRTGSGNEMFHFSHTDCKNEFCNLFVHIHFQFSEDELEALLLFRLPRSLLELITKSLDYLLDTFA